MNEAQDIDSPGGAGALRGGAREGILLTVAYDGSRFSGVAPQTNARTVAGVLLPALRTLDPGVDRLRIVSRTDAGVHASGQLIAFDTSRLIGPRGWVLGAGRALPSDVALVSAERVAAGFEPRRFALRKRYRYRLLRSPVHDPFWAARAWRVGAPLELGRMRDEAASLLGTHDFRAFRGSADTREETQRTLTELSVDVEPAEPRLLVVSVTGDRFLYHMVRIIVGTLFDVGRGHLPLGSAARGLATGERRALGMTAPPEGLTLERIDLGERGTERWPDALFP